MVKQDIGALNRNIAQLQALARKDSSILANRSAQTYAKNVVLSLQSRLAHMSRRFKQVLEVCDLYYNSKFIFLIIFIIISRLVLRT